MSEKTAIQWTDHTFNIAWGCTKVSAGCTNCYADRDATRYGFDIWGPKTDRRTFGDKHWGEPLKWDRTAANEKRRHRVFCSSMCDVFEDHPTIDAEREKLWPLIRATPWLDWQILTKRVERMAELAPQVPLPNVWVGASAEDQETFDERMPRLSRVPGLVSFLSLEPLLGPIDLCFNIYDAGQRPDWVIVGGESGPGARPCDVAWIRSILKQCREAGVACFVKQIGARPHADIDEMDRWPFTSRAMFENRLTGDDYEDLRLRDRKGGDTAEWPEDLRVREFPPSPERASADGGEAT